MVALESTIVAHGFPYPDSLDVAHALHAAVADGGATPAMIAIVDGEVRVGLDDENLDLVARAVGVEKCGIGDIAPICARRGDGATTISASIAIAALAGIDVFATGGLGGVHRQRAVSADHPPDVSADLMALSRTPIAVVSSGAKMLLDLPATVEALETLGVPVLGFGTDHFPAFYATSSEIPLRHRFDDVEALARAIHHQRVLAPRSGLLVCNPPPSDVALRHDELDRLVERALAEADAAHVVGAAVTPYVLQALHRLSGGRTIVCNRALAANNAGLAARLSAVLTFGGSE